MQELIDEIHRAEKSLEEWIPHYYDKEKELPGKLKFQMLLNDWTSPVIACEELLKRIFTNEMLIRRKVKKFSDVGYKSSYRELERKLQGVKNSRGVKE